MPIYPHHLLPILAPNYKQHILSPAEVRKVCYSLAELCQMCLFEFIRAEGVAKFTKHCSGGASYKRLGTSAVGCMMYNLNGSSLLWFPSVILEQMSP
jgi:hypothetical protein